MSDITPQKPQPDQSSGSGHTGVSRHPYLRDSISSKRVCFYKSGDPQFNGLRMVINSRTFKTFDGLLDSLSKKVPLPFGVRNITTPRGIHAVKTLEELEDGKSYICSDQKKVKPINLEKARKKLPPWYSARPVSARRRMIQLARQNPGRPARRDNMPGVWTPKRLVVFRNGDPSIKHTIMLHKKSTQTFESLLDYMSEVMQFPVAKLYTPDGRRVDGLPALILCSGAVVAAGREPFKSGNYDLQKPSLPVRLPAISSRRPPNTLQPKTRKKKSVSSSSKSRNFSLSSERFFVNQIHNSMAGSLYDLPSNPMGSVEMESNNPLGFVETETCTCPGELAEDNALLPPDDDIEKSFRVNQDGSMTVEMKVRLTIKEEETVHWSTTLTRSSVANQLKADWVSQSEPDGHSPDSNFVPSREIEEPDTNGYEYKEDNNIPRTENGYVCEEEGDEMCSATAESNQPSLRRAPTPGPRCVKKKHASMESINMETETGSQESVLGAYSYTEETADGKVSEEYCMVRQCSSRPIPKPRRHGSVEINNNRLHPKFKSSEVAEILQIQDHGEQVTETVLHIYEQQSYHDNFFANTQFHVQSHPMYGMIYERPASVDTAIYSSSNDFEVDLKRPSSASESLSGRKADTLSLSSETRIPSSKYSNDLTSFTGSETQTLINSLSEISLKEREFSELVSEVGRGNPVVQNVDQGKRKPSKPKVKQNNVIRSMSPDKKRKDLNIDMLKDIKKVKMDILSWAGIKNQQSSVQIQHKQSKTKKKKKESGEGNSLIKGSKSVAVNIENSNGLSSEADLIKTEEKPVRDHSINMNTIDTPTLLRKKLLEVLPPVEATHVRKILMKQNSMNEESDEIGDTQDLSENVPLPALHSSPSVVKQYVEHWLERSQPVKPSYMDHIKHRAADKQARLALQVKSGEQSLPEESEIKCQTSKPILEDCLTSTRNTTEGLISDVLTEETEEGSDDGQHKKHSFSTQSTQNKTHKNPDMIQTGTNKYFASKITEQPDMKPVLEQLCFSIQSIRQMSQHKHPSCLEKSHSLPDFSSHVASTFGSPSKVLLAFLSVMALKQGISNLNNNDCFANNVSCSEALKMMESLKKIASIEDAEELKVSLSELQKSTSAQLLQSWREFQKLNDKALNGEIPSDNYEHELSFEGCPEESIIKKEQPLGIQALVEEHGMTTTLNSTQFSDFVHGRSSDVDSEGKSSIGESCPQKQVNDFEESVLEEDAVNLATSISKEEVKNISLSFMGKPTSADFDTGTSVEEDSEKEAAAIFQQANLKEKQENCTEEEDSCPKHLTNHEEEQTSCEDEQVCCEEWKTSNEEEQDHCIEKHASCEEEEVSHEDEQTSFVQDQDSCEEQQIEEEGNNREKQASYKGEPPSYAAEIESYEPSYTEELTSHIEEQDNKIENWTSQDGEQANYVENHSYEEKQSTYEKEQSSLEEENNSYVEGQTNSKEIQSSHGKDTEEQTSYEEDQSGYEEEQALCEEEQASYIQEQVNNSRCQSSGGEEQSGYTEDQSSYIEQQSSQKEERDSYAEQKGSHLEQQANNDVEQASYVEEQTSYEEKHSSFEKNEALCMEEQGCHKEEQHSYEEKKISFDEDETPCGEDPAGLVGEQVSYAEQLASDDEKQSSSKEDYPSCIEQQSDSFEEEHSYAEEKSSLEQYAEKSGGDDLCDKQRKAEELKMEASQACTTHDKRNINDLHSVVEEDEEEERKESQGCIRNSVSESVKTLENLVNSVTSAPTSSSSLAFSYDSKGSLKREAEGTRVRSIREMFLAKNNKDFHHGNKQLQSSSTSDLSDYRSETSDSGGYRSQPSLETSTESGEDDSGRMSIAKGYVRRAIERLYGRSDPNVKECASKRPPSAPKSRRKQSPGKNSVGSLTSLHEARTKMVADLSYFNATSSYDVYNEATQCIAMKAQGDMSEGVLIDKGRWLLKENHLIRKSPPEHSGMYGNLDTMSADTGQENTSDDVPYSHFGNRQSSVAAISSPELDQAEPAVPKCTYFNLPHGSDSDPFQDDLNNKSNSSTKTDAVSKKKDTKISPTDEASKTWAEKNGSLPSFTSAEFKVTDNKVHPEASAVITQPSRAQTRDNRAIQEQDPLEMLHFFCGQHCPIL